MILATMLLLGGATLQDPAATPPENPAERVICINRIKTGSRVNFEQICHTKAEWDQMRSENRRVVERGQANRGLRDPTGQ